MVDLDAETWTLWQANATTDTRLVGIGGDCTENERPDQESDGTAVDEEDNADGPGSSTPTQDASTEKAVKMDTGAIIGIAIGAASGVGLIAGAIAISILRKRRRNGRSGGKSAISLTRNSPESDPRAPIWHEKPASSVQELSALRVYQHELPVKERPLEVPGAPWDNRPVELPAMQTPKP